jgi:hypothetical protein
VDKNPRDSRDSGWVGNPKKYTKKLCTFWVKIKILKDPWQAV